MAMLVYQRVPTIFIFFRRKPFVGIQTCIRSVHELEQNSKTNAHKIPLRCSLKIQDETSIKRLLWRMIFPHSLNSLPKNWDSKLGFSGQLAAKLRLQTLSFWMCPMM